MYKIPVYCLIFLLNSSRIFAFQEIKKDTSYTVNSSYLKYKKNFPNIEIVRPSQFQNVSEIDNIIYKKTQKRSLSLDAFVNYSENNPIVILIHGGGWKSGNKSHMKPLAQNIASRGYSCFAIEYRLSDETKYPEGIYDVKQAIKFVKENAKKYHVDNSRIAILGTSSGAQMATLIGVTSDKTLSSVQAIINLDGVLAFNHPESKEGKLASFWLGGTYKEKPEIWEEASALTHVDENSPPILFINSQYERFHAGRNDMIKILKKHNIYSQVETFSQSPHTFWLFHPYFSKTVNYIVQFLDKTLKDK